MFESNEQYKDVFGDEIFGDPIQNPDLRNLVMRCESVVIPGVNFFTSDNIRRYGYGPIERRPYLPQFKNAFHLYRDIPGQRSHAYCTSYPDAIFAP